MATSPLLQIELQETGTNANQWGAILNNGALQLLEDGIAGTSTADVTVANVTLETDAGGQNPPHYRMMIINITSSGDPGANRDVLCPALSKVYLVANNTTGGRTITFRTVSGSGITIPASSAIWCYCDGTDIVGASVANASTADLATDSLDAQLLDGLDSTAFGRIATASTWTAGQATQAQEILLTVGGPPYYLDINCAQSNCFYHLTTQNFTLRPPTGATVGQRFSLIVEQGSGAPDTIAFTTSPATFQAAGGQAPVLSTGVGDVDYLGFEYYPSSLGNRWIVSILQNIGPV